jgi:hypothetical protein
VGAAAVGAAVVGGAVVVVVDGGAELVVVVAVTVGRSGGATELVADLALSRPQPANTTAAAKATEISGRAARGLLESPI